MTGNNYYQRFESFWKHEPLRRNHILLFALTQIIIGGCIRLVWENTGKWPYYFGVAFLMVESFGIILFIKWFIRRRNNQIMAKEQR